MMNKRNNSSSGGGQSSLGYLFGTSDPQQQQQLHDHKPKVTFRPPYDVEMKSPEKALTPTPLIKKDHDNNTNDSHNKFIYHGSADGLKSKDFLVTGRPSTKVRSVPGGDSSLGYLFGDHK